VTEETKFSNFIRQIVEADLASGKHERIVTRFPPEPNGYLHIGHAKSICLNFGIARDYNGLCHLRFDDTNPIKEDLEYIESIQEDVRWLGFDWGPHLHHAADYFEQLFEWAGMLIRKGKAYVCDLSAEEIRKTRGTLTEPGLESPHRNRSVEENLDLFRRMRAGEFPNGARVLRAKIDMASPNLNLRDPVMYRILHASHHRTGDAWSIYPTYDWAHGQSDAIEGITHSLCTLEFEDHRPLYDWYLEQLEIPHRPRQIEFARLNLGFTVLSKRVLNELVGAGLVAGWDDPRMPTLAGLRRRGYTPEAIRLFCDRIRVAKADSLVDMELLENTLREDLNTRAPRAMCVHRPLKVVLTDFPEGTVQEITAPRFPDDPSLMGHRRIPFTRELYVEREDFMETPSKKFHRLGPGREVRLRFAYVIRCDEVVKDPVTGEVVELRCSHDPATFNAAPVGRKVPGTIHWVSAAHSVPLELRLYDRLFTVPSPMAGGGDYKAHLNPASLEVLTGARGEPALAETGPGDRVQFERKAFYIADARDSKPGRPVFNRIVSLRDTWARTAGSGAA
jgi:glutaminyl-tRNA synthetase